MRLVDADALKAKAFGKRGGLIHTSDIDAAPTVDAVPVVHGRWIDKSGGIEGAWNYCSVCGEQAIDLYDYCPNCGARMDGKDGDHEKADLRR